MSDAINIPITKDGEVIGSAVMKDDYVFFPCIQCNTLIREGWLDYPEVDHHHFRIEHDRQWAILPRLPGHP